MLRLWWWCSLASLVGSLLIPATALAQQDNVDAARAAEAAARTAFRKKNYAEAAEGFAAAFKLDPKGNTKYNEAQAWKKAGEDGAAADAYEEAVTFGGLDKPLERKADAALKTLKTELGRLVAKEPVGAKITVGHAKDRVMPARIHLAPGEHEVTIRFEDGATTTETVTVVAGEDLDRAFTPPKKPDPDPQLPKPDPKPGEAPADNTGVIVAGWVSLSLGAGGLIAMGALGGLTLSKVSQYDDTGNTDPELFDEATTLKTTTNILLGVGAGLGALGVTLILVGYLGEGDEGADQAVYVEPTADGIRVRF